MREAVSSSVYKCQQLSKQQLVFRLGLEGISGLLGKCKDNMGWSLGGLSSKPLFYSVQNQFMYSNLPPPLDGQMQRAVSLLGYTASLVSRVGVGGCSGGRGVAGGGVELSVTKTTFRNDSAPILLVKQKG
jgi:hypothetical protein